MRIPVPAAIFLFVFSFLIDIYIYADVCNSTKRRGLRSSYAVSSLLCWGLLVVIMCMPKRSEDSDILPIMWMLYTYLSIYIAKAGYLLCSVFGRLIKVISRSKSKRYISCLTGVGVGVVLFVSMWWGVLYTRYHIEVVPVEISSAQIPESFNGYKIAQISDLHVGTWGNDTTFISNLVDSVNALHPDLIVFTGDIVNRRTSEVEPFVKPLSRLKAPDGVMSILGNHDYGDYMDWTDLKDREINNQELLEHQKSMGWDILNNDKRFIVRGNDSILVIGVENWGDPPFHTYGDLELALSSSRDSTYHQNDNLFKILLSHNPAHWDKEVSHQTNIGLTLSGHTHAMQVETEIFGWRWSPAKYRYEHWGGYFERLNDNGQPVRLYVNIGAGEVGLPSRLFRAYPEITLLTLHN